MSSHVSGLQILNENNYKYYDVFKRNAVDKFRYEIELKGGKIKWQLIQLKLIIRQLKWGRQTKINVWTIKQYVLSVSIPNDDINKVISVKKKNDSIFLKTNYND